MRWFHSILWVSLVFPASITLAEEVPEHFTPVGSMGMGGAYTAVAHDDEAVWTNPAGIARTRKARSRNTLHAIKFPNLIVGANSSSRSFYKGFSSAQDKSVEALVEGASDLGTKPFWVRAAAFPVALFDTGGRNAPMALGMYSNTTVKALVDKDTPTEASVSGIADIGTTLGAAFTTDSNRASFGVQVRPIYRYAYEGVIPSNDLVDRSAMQAHFKADSNRATGVGLDAGAMLTLADFWFPTIGVAALNLPTGCATDYLNPFTEERQNICGTYYRGDFGNPDALSVVDPTDLRVGLAISPRLSRDFTMRFALDLHNLYAPAGSNYYGLPGIEASKLLHGGVEFFLGNPLEQPPISLRLGASQGFMSFGAAVNFGYLAFDISSYGQDISSSASPREDRRTLVGLTAVF